MDIGQKMDFKAFLLAWDSENLKWPPILISKNFKNSQNQSKILTKLVENPPAKKQSHSEQHKSEKHKEIIKKETIFCWEHKKCVGYNRRATKHDDWIPIDTIFFLMLIASFSFFALFRNRIGFFVNNDNYNLKKVFVFLSPFWDN